MNTKETPFIGRKKELAFLEKQYKNKGGQLVIIYGRRRIGKTETIKQFCKNKDAIFFTCTQTEDRNQLQAFSRIIFSYDIPAKQFINEFSDWEQAFLSIKDIPIKQEGTEQGKKILVIDEFPYMAKENPSIPSILQKLWDTQLKDENIMIILCGSAMSYIEKEILAEKNPLYGRASGIYKMLPMNYFDAAQFFPNFNNYEKIAAYSILGGIPFYLKQFDDSLSLEENICENILEKGSILYSEPEFLLRQELREPGTYNTIIQSVAFGNTKFNEIQQSTLIEKGKLSVYLKNLIELGILERDFPVLSTSSSMQKGSRGIYKLKDLFFRFWYSFVFPNLSPLEFGNIKIVYKNIISEKLDQFISLPFENICTDWLSFENINNNLPFNFINIGHWWNKETEIDIIASDFNMSKIISGECKFHKSLCDERDLKKHISKDLKDLKLKDNCELFYYYFSWSGFTESGIKFARENNIRLVRGDEVFCQK